MTTLGSTDATKHANPRWGDIDSDNGNNLDSFLLPPKQVIGPNEKGIKKVIEQKFNEENQITKITTTSKIKSLRMITKPAVAHRRSWAKFGDALNDEGGTNLTVVSKEEVTIQRPKAIGTDMTHENVTKTTKDENVHTLLKLCRTCNKRGHHWTAQCPYKDLAAPTSSDVSSSEVGAGSVAGKYVAPSRRPGAEMALRNDGNSVKVSNLSEDVGDADLWELFGAFGEISRAHVVVDRDTQVSRGFGFDNFVRKEHAQMAIHKLDGYGYGYGYDNLILSVEWAEPRIRPT